MHDKNSIRIESTYIDQYCFTTNLCYNVEQRKLILFGWISETKHNYI